MNLIVYLLWYLCLKKSVIYCNECSPRQMKQNRQLNGCVTLIMLIRLYNGLMTLETNEAAVPEYRLTSQYGACMTGPYKELNTNRVALEIVQCLAHYSRIISCKLVRRQTLKNNRLYKVIKIVSFTQILSHYIQIQVMTIVWLTYDSI